MYSVILQNVVKNFPNLNLPPVCAEQPECNSFYCKTHAAMMQTAGLGHSKSETRALKKQLQPAALAELFQTPGKITFYL